MTWRVTSALFFTLFIFSFFHVNSCVFSQSSNTLNNYIIPYNVEKLNMSNFVYEFSPENIMTNLKFPYTSSDITNSTVQCNKQLSELAAGLENSENWALKMIDASSKIPSGILQGNLKDIGAYDECVEINTMKNNETIQGNHCMYSILINSFEANVTLTLTLSICVPTSCQATDIHQSLQSMADTVTQNNSLDLKVTSVTCSSIKEKPWDSGTIITVTVLCIFIAFLVVCTIFDIFLRLKLCADSGNNFSKGIVQFSLYKSSEHIFNTTSKGRNLPSISGIRCLSMLWVIFGHTYIMQVFGAVVNAGDLPKWLTSWNSLHILLAPFAVDTFFVMSGFLTCYLFLKEIPNRTFNLFGYYLHRYIRLTPAFAALILLAIYILPRMGSGALWNGSMGQQEHLCSRHWWRLLLYIHNYGSYEYLGCLGHSWYLAVDMQLFWISPLILYPLAKKPKIGYLILWVFIVTSMIVPAVISAENKFSGGLFTNNKVILVDQMLDFYVVTYTRSGPWLLGILLGYHMSQNRKNHNIRFIWGGWILTILAFSFILFTYRIFQNKNYSYNIYWEIFYAAFSKHIWAFGVCWMIYISAIGYGGVIEKILSHPVFLPFSRISYSVYLVHYVIQTMKMAATRTPAHFTNMEMIIAFMSDMVLCIFGGYVFNLIFESPFLIMEKVILGRRK